MAQACHCSQSKTSRVLEVSRSGACAHARKATKPSKKQDQLLTMKIKDSFVLSRQTYGSPRIQFDLRDQGLRCGKNRINRLMKAPGLRPKQKQKFRPISTKSDPGHHSKIALNWLARVPSPDKPDQIWVADITYIHTQEGWLYSAGIMDRCSRKLVGYHSGDDLTTALITTAWNKALKARRMAPGLLHHSDRGCQNTSSEFIKLLQHGGFAASMSRKGNCYDNAFKESFWAALKAECFGTFIPPTKAQARMMIFDYIEAF